MFLGSPTTSGVAGIGPSPLRPQANNPRALLKINDHIIRRIDSLEYIENNYYQPDSFRAVLPLYHQADAINIEYWLSQPAILVEVFTGYPHDAVNYGVGDLQSLVLGGINDLGVKVFENGGGFIEFNGFDLSKKFIDNKTTEKYQNQTSSQIATILANNRGLTPVVTPTTTPAGFYYNQDYVQLGNQVTEWDLLTYLAQNEGFTVFVRGMSLYFQPRTVDTSTPYLFQANTPENGSPIFNGTRLVVSRNLNYARDVIVNINSWNAKSGKVTAQVRGTPTKKTVLSAAAQPIGQAQTFTYFIPGLSKQQAIERGQKILEDISIHERILDVKCPADNNLRKDTVIQLKGVSPSADQTYYPDTITRMMDGRSGAYTMEVRAKNHSPQSVVTI